MGGKICPDCGRKWRNWDAHKTGNALTCAVNQAENHVKREQEKARTAGWAPVGGFKRVLGLADVPFLIVPDNPHAVPQRSEYKHPSGLVTARIVGGIPQWYDAEWAPWWAVRIADLGTKHSRVRRIKVEHRAQMIKLLFDRPKEREILQVKAMLSRDRHEAEQMVMELAQQLYDSAW